MQLLLSSAAVSVSDASSSRFEEAPLPSESSGIMGAMTFLNAYEGCFEFRVLAFVAVSAFARAIASSVVMRFRRETRIRTAQEVWTSREAKNEVRATMRAIRFDRRDSRIPARSRVFELS